LVRTGDIVSVNTQAGTLNMHVSDEELARRRAAWSPPPNAYERSYAALYQRHVNQAPAGCDFDFLSGQAPTPEPPIF
jgi:dihydroxy-acid dehydratase